MTAPSTMPTLSLAHCLCEILTPINSCLAFDVLCSVLSSKLLSPVNLRPNAFPAEITENRLFINFCCTARLGALFHNQGRGITVENGRIDPMGRFDIFVPRFRDL